MWQPIGCNVGTECIILLVPTLQRGNAYNGRLRRLPYPCGILFSFPRSSMGMQFFSSAGYSLSRTLPSCAGMANLLFPPSIEGGN